MDLWLAELALAEVNETGDGYLVYLAERLEGAAFEGFSNEQAAFLHARARIAASWSPMRRRKRQEQAEHDDKPEAVVPLDPVNEAVVIAAACVSKEVADELLPTVPADHFFGRGHAKAWDTLREMHRRKLYYDPSTVTQMSGGEVDVAYLETLIKERPERPPNLRHHIDALRWDKARVDTARGPLAALLAALHDVTTAPDRVRQLARQIGESFAGHGSDRYIATALDVSRVQSKILLERLHGLACYSYGIPTLDTYSDGPNVGRPRMIPGAAPGKITCFTGTSGSGKTTIACQIILEMARQKRRCLVGAWETGPGPTLELMASMSLGFSRTDVMTGQYNQDDVRDLCEEMERIGEYVKFFRLPFGKARAERGGGQNDRQLDIIRQVIADSRAEVFLADLMRRAMKETRPDDEEQFLFRLQADGEELGVHQIWLHQILSKELEQRRDKRPTRDALKGSFSWVEVPDTVIGWHREALWKDVTDDSVQAIIMKQRYGDWPMAVEFDWDKQYGMISNGRSIEYARPGEDSDLDTFISGGGRGRRH